MKGIELTLSANKRDLILSIEPLLIDKAVGPKAVFQLFNSSSHSGYYLDESAVISICDALSDALTLNEMSPITKAIAHAKDTEIEITIAADKMSADLTLISPYMGLIPSAKEIFDVLKQHDVTKGISKKRIELLLQQVSDAPGGRSFTQLIAKGLAPRAGKNSIIKALIPCALERVLSPKFSEDSKVDMRDFGDILCVEKGQKIAQRMAPSVGRSGFTVSGKRLACEPGQWLPINLGEQAYVSKDNENMVLASIAGLPKVTSSKVNVDDVYTLKGVNIATGNINFEGSVIVNGDITEKMQVTATGDVTINGFVESATVKAGGDITVTQGVSGKLQNLDCIFTAGGTVYIGHAQGLTIVVNKDLIIDKQLAYSHVTCKGNITVGKVAKPLGKLFASTIICAKKVHAGHIGAVSGSSLNIDYSDMYNLAQSAHEKLNAEYEKLATKNADHEIVMAKIQNRKPSKALHEKLSLMKSEIDLERVFLNWLRVNVKESKAHLDSFEKHAKIVANGILHAGVSLKLNNKHFLTKKDYEKCQVILENKDWVYMPLR